MRIYNPSFAAANSSPEKEPRFVIKITYDTDSIYLTSHKGIPSVPGIVIENVLQRPSALSQKIVPDEGRSEIGALSFSAVDLGGVVTEALRTKLAAGNGLRNKIAQLNIGWAGADFSQYQVFQTQLVSGNSFRSGVQNFQCSDIAREQRKTIFEPKRTTLAASITAIDATIPVLSVEGFEMIAHGSSFSDAPNTTCGYLLIENERIRYTGIQLSPPAFTGCTRARFNSRAVAHAVDVTQPTENRTAVEELIYLELPVPKLILAILTGELYGQSGARIPEHWNLGIVADLWIKTDDFTNIGDDLWSLADDNVSFVARFLDYKRIDGKQFLEKECYLLIGCYPRIYSDGRLGIKRMNPVLADAPAVAELNESNCVSWTDLTVNMNRLSNSYRVEWNFSKDDNNKYLRSTEFIDATSIAIHKATDVKVLQFKGMYGGRHTNATVRARIDAYRDRYSHPPVEMQVTALPSLSYLEVGDIVRANFSSVRDWTAAGPGGALNRSMEIQQKSENHATGQVTFSLFGSTSPASELPTDPGGGGGGNALPDSFYNSQGTPLTSVLTIVVVGDLGIVQPGTYHIYGHANLTNNVAIYYYLGDLEISEGVTIYIHDNVQLRIRGFLTNEGVINGVGLGIPGAVDTAAYGTTVFGTAGFFGNSRGMDGVNWTYQGRIQLFYTVPAVMTAGQVSSIPYFSLTFEAGVLNGLPSDLRGTSGGAGGKLIRPRHRNDELAHIGGPGGAGGAGLCIISRGLAVGVSGLINTSGGNSAAQVGVQMFFDTPSRFFVPGAGGAGAPGGLLVLVDGSTLPVPDLGGRFLAKSGHVGAPLINPMTVTSGSGVGPWRNEPNDREGFIDPAMISDRDLSNSAYRIQYIPGQQTPVENTPNAVPSAVALTTSSLVGGIRVDLGLPAFDTFDSVRLYMAATNDRTASTLYSEFKASTIPVLGLGSGVTRYFWAQLVRGALVSEWYPSSSTGGVSGTSS